MTGVEEDSESELERHMQSREGGREGEGKREELEREKEREGGMRQREGKRDGERVSILKYIF